MKIHSLPSLVRGTSLHFLLLFAALIFSTPAPAAEPAPKPTPTPHASMVEITDDPALPRVFIIGDSISMGYTIPVREILKGKANVHRPLTNCESTRLGLKKLDQWLGTGKWAVIHFNWGLHDLKYIDEQGKMVDVKKGRQYVPVEEYEKNLRQIVERLKKTGAKLIWCSTTPVPAGTGGRVQDDELKYNEAAMRVMKEAGVALDDLHAFVLPRQEKVQLKHNVHFSTAGYQELAGQVAGEIQKALPAK